jgi:hypothetical protein
MESIGNKRQGPIIFFLEDLLTELNYKNLSTEPLSLSTEQLDVFHLLIHTFIFVSRLFFIVLDKDNYLVGGLNLPERERLLRVADLRGVSGMTSASEGSRHDRTAPSSPAEKSSSSWMARELTESEWTFKEATQRPEAMLQRRTLWSREAETTNPRQNNREVTRPAWPTRRREKRGI